MTPFVLTARVASHRLCYILTSNTIVINEFSFPANKMSPLAIRRLCNMGRLLAGPPYDWRAGQHGWGAVGFLGKPVFLAVISTKRDQDRR